MCIFGYGIVSTMGSDHANVYVCTCNMVSADAYELSPKNKNKHKCLQD